MPTFPSRSAVAALLAVTAAAIAVPRLAGWIPADQLLEFAGFVLAAIPVACLGLHEAAAANRSVVPPSFVVTFASLMLFGPHAASCVAAAATVATALVTVPVKLVRLPIAVAVIIAATESAGFAYQLAARLPAVTGWLLLAASVGAAVAAYHVVRGGLSDVIVPLITRQPIDRTWPQRALAGSSVYFLAAGAGAVVFEVIDRRAWNIAPVVGVALIFAYRTYSDYGRRLAEDRRRREVVGHLEQGISVLDHVGRVALWDDALEHLLQCSSRHAVGRFLIDAVPSLVNSDLPRALKETLADKSPRTLNHLKVTAGTTTRIVQVKLLPVVDGIALLWQDVTERDSGRQRAASKRRAAGAGG